MQAVTPLFWGHFEVLFVLMPAVFEEFHVNILNDGENISYSKKKDRFLNANIQ